MSTLIQMSTLSIVPASFLETFDGEIIDLDDRPTFIETTSASIDCCYEKCANCATHYDANGEGYCIFHWGSLADEA